MRQHSRFEVKSAIRIILVPCLRADRFYSVLPRITIIPALHGKLTSGVTWLDADGKIAITKDTVTESYWKHPKNPNKLDAGYTSGLTEITVRKIPQATSP